MKKIKIITFALLLGIFGSKDIMHCQLSVTNPTQETQDLLSHIESYLEQIEQGMNQVNTLKETIFSKELLDGINKTTKFIKQTKEIRDNLVDVTNSIQNITEDCQDLIKMVKSMSNSRIMYDQTSFTQSVNNRWSEAFFPEQGIMTSGWLSLNDIKGLMTFTYNIINAATNIVFKIIATFDPTNSDFQDMTVWERILQTAKYKKELEQLEKDVMERRIAMNEKIRKDAAEKFEAEMWTAVRNKMPGLPENTAEILASCGAGLNPTIVSWAELFPPDQKEAQFEKESSKAVTEYAKLYIAVRALFYLLSAFVLVIGIGKVWVRLQMKEDPFKTIVTWSIALILVLLLGVAADTFYSSYTNKQINIGNTLIK